MKIKVISMNKKDFLIITCLRKNARESLTNMSKRTNIPISTIYERLKTNTDGLIHKHTSLIDFNKLGFSTRANIMLRVHKDSKEDLKKYLLNYFQVNSLYRINNGYDFLVEGIFRHLKELEEFLDNLETRFNIEHKEIHYIIDDLKREAFMTDPLFLELAQN